MKICPDCGCENANRKVFCVQCGKRVGPDTLWYTITMMYEYLKSYEWVDWWRFELCILASLAFDAACYFLISDTTAWLRISGLMLIIGVVAGFIWQWVNRYNL
jgi:hypothetical protein